MSGVVNPVCRPSGPLGFYFASATGAFDPGRGCTSPPGLEPIDPAEDVPALRAWNQSTRQRMYQPSGLGTNRPGKIRMLQSLLSLSQSTDEELQPKSRTELETIATELQAQLRKRMT
jgi:hypothetical protein